MKDANKCVLVSGANDGVVAGFNARFPKIALNLTTDLSKYNDARIDRSFDTGIPYADVVISQVTHDLYRWKDANRLLYYKPPNFEDVYNDQKDPDGAFNPTGIRKKCPAYTY